MSIRDVQKKIAIQRFIEEIEKLPGWNCEGYDLCGDDESMYARAHGEIAALPPKETWENPEAWVLACANTDAAFCFVKAEDLCYTRDYCSKIRPQEELE